MFSPDIVCSEEFLDMPPSSRELYFQLGMRADDDGFVQPKTILRLIGATSDDLRILITKRFILPFDTGVVVIKHWLIHNMIRLDRYKETRFLEEKKRLYIKENKAYTDHEESGVPLLATIRQPNGNHPAPQVRLGKVSIGKDTNTDTHAHEDDEEEIQVVEEKAPTPAQIAREFFDRGNAYDAIFEALRKPGNEEALRSELEKFILYWTEPNKSGTKERWQGEKTFEVKRRLYTWLGRVRGYSGQNFAKGKKIIGLTA